MSKDIIYETLCIKIQIIHTRHAHENGGKTVSSMKARWTRSASFLHKSRRRAQTRATQLFFVGGYPCCKGKVYAENRTTNALLNGMSRLGFSAFIYWIDSVLFSGNKTNAPFDFDRIGPILSKYPELRREFFLRFQHGVCALHRNRDFSQENECVVCVLCGKDIAEQAFDRWVEAGFIINEDVLYSGQQPHGFSSEF